MISYGSVSRGRQGHSRTPSCTALHLLNQIAVMFVQVP